MAKLSRREYLTLMSVGAGVALAASCKSGVEPSKPTNTGQPSAAEVASPNVGTRSEAPRIWNSRWSDPFPKQPDQLVKLIFHGLGSFSPGSQGGKTNCEVGFHSSGDELHRHQLSIFAFTNGPGTGCTTIYNSKEAKEQIARIDLEVARPEDNFSRAYFYQPGEAQKRADLNDPKDFRWIVDFESDYVYRNFPGAAQADKLTKIPFIYRPRFTVPCGLFYTLRKTASTFFLKSNVGNLERELGNVADVIGANVYVKPGESVNLSVNTKPYKIQAPGEIYFINTCTKTAGGGVCTPKPSDPNKKLRGDFYLHYKGFELEGRPEFELLLRQAQQQSARPDVFCNPKALDPHVETSDESPCAAAGYSGGV